MLAVPPKVPRSVIAPVCQRKAWVVREEVVLRPTTAPDRLMPSATLKPPPRSPRSDITPFCQRKACSAPEAVAVSPTTCPKSLMPKASARSLAPPNDPRSVITPSCHRKAWGRIPEVVVLLSPTTCPKLLMPKAMLAVPPKVPKSVTVIVKLADTGCANAKIATVTVRRVTTEAAPRIPGRRILLETGRPRAAAPAPAAGRLPMAASASPRGGLTRASELRSFPSDRAPMRDLRQSCSSSSASPRAALQADVPAIERMISKGLRYEEGCSRRRVRLPGLATHRFSIRVFHWQHFGAVLSRSPPSPSWASPSVPEADAKRRSRSADGALPPSDRDHYAGHP